MPKVYRCKRKCRTCGELVKNKYNRYFCNLTCWKNFRKVLRRCPICKKIFKTTVFLIEVMNQRACSTKCAQVLSERKVSRRCDYCKKFVTKRKSRMVKSKKVYCNRDCYSNGMIGNQRSKKRYAILV